jgi:hypothetical protein
MLVAPGIGSQAFGAVWGCETDGCNSHPSGVQLLHRDQVGVLIYHVNVRDEMDQTWVLAGNHRMEWAAVSHTHNSLVALKSDVRGMFGPISFSVGCTSDMRGRILPQDKISDD